jgi:ABC-type spermidine/putrescine transport system permease subunit II
MSSTGRSAPVRRFSDVVGWAGLAALYAFLYMPLATIAIFSLNDSTVQSLPFSGFTTAWYEAIPDNRPMLESVRFSLVVAAIVVAVSAGIGVLFALVLQSSASRSARVLEIAIAVPAVVPGMVLGLSLALAFRELGIGPGLVTVVAGHVSFTVPVVMFLVLTRLRRLDPSLVHASLDLGASALQTFRHVVFPQIRSTLFAACLLALTLSFDDAIVTFFLVGTRSTLPVFIWGQTRFGFTPEINATVTLIGAVSITVVVIAATLVERDRHRDT